jgi:hypothetical protein
MDELTYSGKFLAALGDFLSRDRDAERTAKCTRSL